MEKKKKGLFPFIVITVIMAGVFALSTTAAGKNFDHKQGPAYHPVIFIHGGSGSASQFESQAMRFTSNGFPQDYLFVFEYDSSYEINTRDDILAALDAFVVQVLEATGAEQVDIMGHSHGTTIMHDYLGRSEGPERAEKIAHYVNIDGRIAAEEPAGVKTLAIWAGRGTPGREIAGAVNVTLENQTHIQAATSPEAFYEMYKFLVGELPLTTDVVTAPWGSIRLSGRAVFFPQNIGVEGATLEIYKISGYDGQRIRKNPEAVYTIGDDGRWGPFKAMVGEYYEFVIVRPESNHHFYKEPFIRDDHFIRLLTSPVGGGLAAYMHYDDGQTNIVISRDKELWGDQGVENDILAINGVNIVNEATCPIEERISSVFVYDYLSDQESNISEPIWFFASIHFITGVDLFIPAADPPDKRTRLTMIQRGGNGLVQTINIPSWPSTSDRISVQFNDFVQWDVMEMEKRRLRK